MLRSDSDAPVIAGEPTIFVVDDDDSLRRGLVRLLRAAGFKVEAFGSAPEFLQRLPIIEHGCMLLDVQMPVVTGPDLHGELLARGIALPVVYLTAHGDLPTGIRAMKNGAVDFLQKPVDESVLVETLREALARHAVLQSRDQEVDEIADRLAALSGREREVLKLAIDGRLNKQIADDLGISIKTVKVHRANMMKTMAVRSVAELVHLCELASSGSGECLFGARTGPHCARRACLNSGGRCERAPRPRA